MAGERGDLDPGGQPHSRRETTSNKEGLVSPIPEERRHGIRKGSPALSSPAAGEGTKEGGKVHAASQPSDRV